MSIERPYGFWAAYIPTCDICGKQLPGEPDFHEAVAAKKRAGWRSRKVDDGWEDVCPDCQEEEKRNGA